MIVDGVELLRMIRDGEIKNKQTFKNINNDLIITYDNKVLYYYNERIECDCELFEDYGVDIVLNCRFEILSEEDTEIDINSIEEFDRPNINLHDFKDVENEIKWLQDAHNKVLKAVKQLNKKIGEK